LFNTISLSRQTQRLILELQLRDTAVGRPYCPNPGDINALLCTVEARLARGLTSVAFELEQIICKHAYQCACCYLRVPFCPDSIHKHLVLLDVRQSRPFRSE
jgi:hypothetical protein